MFRLDIKPSFNDAARFGSSSTSTQTEAHQPGVLEPIPAAALTRDLLSLLEVHSASALAIVGAIVGLST
jgi:hypothetical protein